MRVNDGGRGGENASSGRGGGNCWTNGREGFMTFYGNDNRVIVMNP
jgi:hypothetical protein